MAAKTADEGLPRLEAETVPFEAPAHAIHLADRRHAGERDAAGRQAAILKSAAHEVGPHFIRRRTFSQPARQVEHFGGQQLEPGGRGFVALHGGEVAEPGRCAEGGDHKTVAQAGIAHKRGDGAIASGVPHYQEGAALRRQEQVVELAQAGRLRSMKRVKADLG